MMLQKLSFIVLLFLPVIESFNRQAALFFLFTGSILISYPVFKKKKINIDLINLIFLLFIVWGLFTTIFSLSIIRSLTESARYLSYFLIFVTIREQKEAIKKYSKFFITYILINSIILVLLFTGFTIFSINPPPTSGMNLFYPVFGHNRIDALLIFMIPILSGLFAITENIKHKKILRWGIIFFTLFLIWSLGRGSWWSSGLSFILILIFFPIIRKKLTKITYYFLATFFILTSLIFVSSNYLTARNEGVKSYLGLYKPVNNEKRLSFYIQAFKGFIKSPITGTGLDTFRIISKKYQENPYNWSWFVHNHFIQIFTETGLTGGILFTFLFYFMVKRTYKMIKNYEIFNIRHVIFISLLPSILHTYLDYDWQFIGIFLLIFNGFSILLPVRESEIKIPGKLIWIPALLLFIFTIKNSYITNERLILNGDLKLLNTAEKFDKNSNEIYKSKAETFVKNTDYGNAHINYRKAIILDPLDSGNLIKSDFLLYLEESSMKKSIKPLLLSQAIYPYLYKKYINQSVSTDNIKEFIEQKKNSINENPLRIWEIKEIIKNPDFIN